MTSAEIFDAAGACALGAALWAAYATGIGWRARRGLAVPDLSRRVLFASGATVAVLALWPSVDALADERFSWHMVQHLLLLLVAGLLLALGRPDLTLRTARRPFWLRPVAARRLMVAGVGCVTAIVWAWHVPWLFDAAVADDRVHILEHLSLLGAGAFFWWTIVCPDVRRAAGEGAAVLACVAGGIQMSALGALLVFSASPWYEPYRVEALAQGWSALADQQVAGLLMWIPPAVLQLGVAATLFVLWIRDEGAVAATQRVEPARDGYAVDGRRST